MKNFKITDCRNKKTPKVSVIVSFYKEKKILNKSLQSLKKTLILNQFQWKKLQKNIFNF